MHYAPLSRTAKEALVTDPHRPSRQPAEALPTSRQRLLALSGIAFAVLLCIAWFANGAETPHYTAPDHDWTTWATNTEMKAVSQHFSRRPSLRWPPAPT